MEFLKKIRDGLMGVEYERYEDDEHDDYEYVEDYDDEERERTPLGIFARHDRDEREDDRASKKKNRRGKQQETPRSSRGNRDYDAYEPPRSQRVSRKHSSDSKVLNLPNSYRGAGNADEIVICRPETLEDARPVADYLKNNVICVINLECVDKAVAQRIADFISGACDALNGGIQRISNDIFLIAPANIVITSQIREELKKNGLVLPWIQSAFK